MPDMSLSSIQKQYLHLLGIDVWLGRELPGSVEPEEQHLAPAELIETNRQNDARGWEVLREQVATCTRCELHQGRKQAVFGTGSLHADWLVIGEAPGAEEDRQGEPFVGRAGKLLDAMLEAVGLHRSRVYIANILKCRPPNNRDPRPAEVTFCENYLTQQIELVQPEVILAVGRIAAQNLLNVDTPIGRMRGQRFQYSTSKIPVIVTYHPAYLLRSPEHKRLAWKDLQLAMQVYRKT